MQCSDEKANNHFIAITALELEDREKQSDVRLSGKISKGSRPELRVQEVEIIYSWSEEK